MRAATAREASAWREQGTEKRAAVQPAAGLIRPGVVVGLGSGIIVVDHTKCPPRLGSWVTGRVWVKVGPITASYARTARFVTKDEAWLPSWSA